MRPVRLRHLHAAVATLSFGIASALAASSVPAVANPAELYAPFIAAAGNADSDDVRLRHLQKLARQCEIDGTAVEGLAALIAFVEKWQSPDLRLDFFTEAIRTKGDYDIGVAQTSPLYPIAAFYQGRMLAQTTLESGTQPNRVETYGKPWLKKARPLFELAAQTFPQNRVARMYLGTPIPLDKILAVPKGAPEWAVAEREIIERLTNTIEWWADYGLRTGGKYDFGVFGSSWNDDCEIWRSWAPILIGFESQKANWTQKYFSERLLAQPHLSGGYSGHLRDVEHSAEDLADALTPMMFLEPENPKWRGYAERLMDLFEKLWTGRNERGLLQFKSTYFSSEEIDLTPAHSCDSVCHPRAIMPALLYWQRTNDPRVGKLITEWMRTWVDAAAREERGKPAGILPSTIHWPDGRAGGTGKDWWKPESSPAAFYDFPSVLGFMTNTLLLTYHMTGDQGFLEPLRSMAKARLEWIRSGKTDGPEGSRLWCAARLGELSGTLAKYRFLTGDTQFDDLLKTEAHWPYVQFRMRNDDSSVVSYFRRLGITFGLNFPAYTSEVRFTDRVYTFPMLYQKGWLKEPEDPAVFNAYDAAANDVNLKVHNFVSLYGAITGDPGSPLYFPMNAVRWKTPPRDIAAMVGEAEPQNFSARLYHFGASPRHMGCELLLLKPGAYTYTLASGAGGDRTLAHGKIVIGQAAGTRRLEFALPAQAECLLLVRPSAQ